MRESINPKFIAVALLIIAMLVIPFAALEWGIPGATYEIINGEEINDSESIEIDSSPYSPVYSVILFNDSLMNSDNQWNKIQDIRFNRCRFTRVVTVPYLNVSELILRLSAFIVTGPLEISMSHEDYRYRVNTTGQSGEYCELVKHVSPEDYVFDQEGPGLLWLGIDFEGLDWDVVDQLYFSIQVEFIVSQCPLTIDLQRTNRESMYLLQEFSTIYHVNSKPTFYFNEYQFVLHQVNDTIFLPNGNYSLDFRWWGYNLSFNNISVMNELITIAIRIKSVRFDVEAIQHIPGLEISVGHHFESDELYYDSFLIADSPSFYLPSGRGVKIEVRGGPQSAYWPYHFSFDNSQGNNRNVTLIVEENWILLGDIAFTPGRLVIVIASVFVVIFSIILSRKKLTNNSISSPFILLFLGTVLPSFTFTLWLDDHPVRFPINAYYSISNSLSLGTTTSTVGMNGTATAISNAGFGLHNTLGPISFILVLIVFVGFLFEILNEEFKVEYSDFLTVLSLFIALIIQGTYVIYGLNMAWVTISVNIGVGPFLTLGAFLLWFILFRRKGLPIFESTTQPGR